ncbi:MAG TPA: serine hydrolase domain-containing protein [Pyrinomonadaceae bacterium]|nr:serine hydrolase domain-containing protein [Pyrinomonadaceae bacterium]
MTLTLAAAARPQTTPGTPAGGGPETAKVDQIFAQWDKPDTPGCALAVIKEGRTIYKRGYGAANLELSAPITTSSVFNVGSVAKQFTAASVLMLAQQGKLSLDDEVRKYVPEVPDFGTHVTLRHLLHHTSGLRDFLEVLEMSGHRTSDITTERDVLDMVSRQRTLNHRPGDEFLYTNTGYLLLAVVVARVAGQPLREFAAANIFKPLGMTDTHFYDDHTAIIKGLVDGYLPREGGGFRKWMPADDHAGSSNLFTTVEDLARWDQNFYEQKVGGPALVELMLTPGTLNDGSRLEYAGGLFVTSYKGLRAVVHAGSTLGYQGTLHRFPDQRFSVALLCNVRGVNPDGLARRVADIYLADQLKQTAAAQGEPAVAPPDAVKVPESELSKVAGLYWNPAADTVRRVYVKDGRLMYFRAPGNESELAPLGGNRFLMLGARGRVELTFKSPRAGEPFRLFFTEAGGKPSVHEPVRPASYGPPQLAEFAGEYHSPELDTTYRISPKDDKLLFRTGNWGDFLLSPRFADSFANPQEMGSIIFTRDRRGRVSGFVIRSGKVRNMRFDKVR